jgi:hypothetical protein
MDTAARRCLVNCLSETYNFTIVSISIHNVFKRIFAANLKDLNKQPIKARHCILGAISSQKPSHTIGASAIDKENLSERAKVENRE